MPDSLRLPWKRLFAEGAVIVVSILLAFAIDAWWDFSQERAREASYLSQLERELQSTIDNNAHVAARADSSDRAARKLVRVYYEERSPDPDSVSNWLLATGYWDVQPRLGTVRALVTSGDLALIRDDSLRAMLPDYLASMTAFEESEADGERRFEEAMEDLQDYIDIELFYLQTMSAEERDEIAAANPLLGLPVGPLRRLPTVDLVAAVRTAEVHRVMVRLGSGQGQMRTSRTRMREHTEELLDRVRNAR